MLLSVEDSAPWRPRLRGRSEPGGIDILDPAGRCLGTASVTHGASATEVEVFHGAGGLAVVITDRGVRCICFPGSRVSGDGWSVELVPSTSGADAATPARSERGRPEARQTVTRQAAVMAGGLATRFAPISGPRTGHSKPGVPVAAGTSLMRTIIDRLGEAGIEDVFINTHYAPARLRAGLNGVKPRLHFLHEPVPSGTAGPLLGALRGEAYGELDFDEPLLVVQGDALTDVCLSDFLETHAESGAPALSIAAQRVRDEDVSKYGIIATDTTSGPGRSARVLSFLEKPRLEAAGDHRLASTGIYVLGPALYPLITAAYEHKAKNARPGDAQRLELDFARDVFPLALRQAFERASEPTRAVRAVAVQGYWNDVGNPAQYFQGVRDVRAGRVRLVEPQAPLDGDESGAVYWDDARYRAERVGLAPTGNVLLVVPEEPPLVAAGH